MSINVTYPAEYPEIAVAGPNLKLAHLLNNDLSSVKSEMTTIHQYIFQSWVLKNDYPELSKTLSDLAVVEMRHFNLLGELIFLLGGTPRCCFYQAKQVFPWNGKMVNYTMGIRQLLTADLAAEKAAYRAYSEQAKRVKDGKVAAILSRLAQDEKLHTAIFKKFLEELSFDD